MLFVARGSRQEVTKMLASGPAFSVHGDYTVRSGFTRLQSLLKAHEEEVPILSDNVFLI